MKRVKVREAECRDLKEFGEWLYANRKLNHFDPNIFGYKSTRILAAEDRDGLVLFLPYQMVLMTDSLAPKPGVSKLKKGLALRECIYSLIDHARESGIGEIYFVATDKETEDFAVSQKYEVIEGKLMRLTVSTFPERNSRPQ